jgi:hypothetical protein
LCLRLSQRRAGSGQTTDQPGARALTGIRPQGEGSPTAPLWRFRIAYRPLDTRHGLWAMSRGDRSTETNREGIIWTRTNAKDARSNAWPQPPSPYNPLTTTLAPVEGTPKSHTRKPRQATGVTTW